MVGIDAKTLANLVAYTFTVSDRSWHHGLRKNSAFRILAAILVCLGALVTTPSLANAQTKSLKLYYLHTGEKAEITYKRGGRYLPSGLKKINWHLRDWRRNEPTKMDPELLDLVWEAYRQSGSRDYIHVISGYRSPASNNLLRKRGRGVAKKSQHTLGKALDFFLPDVKLSKLREIGLKLGAGGVGYYPKSGSPFVHFDTGSVRHWPRMTRQQLVKVFPRGDTMHVPTDGKPLARYQQAVANYERRKKSGNLVPQAPAAGAGNFFQRLAALSNNQDDEEEDSSNASAPAPRAVRTTTTPQSAEPQFAALPRRVPVPVLAPRGELVDQGAEIVIAAAEPETPPQPEPVTDDSNPLLRDETAETVDEETSQDDFALASLAVPVPARRPEFETVSEADAASDLDSDPDEAQTPQPDLILVEDDTAPAKPETALAMLDDGSTTPAPTAASRGTLVAALTPSEIEDLRSRVRSTIGQTTLSAPTPAVSVSTQDGIEPSTDPVENVTETAAEQVAAIPVPKQKPAIEEQSPPETSQIQTASLEVEAVETEEVTAEGRQTQFAGIELARLPVPQVNPIANSTTVANEQETSVAQIEDSDSTVEDTAPIVVASTEAPTPTPRPVQEALPQRTISLDRFSAPQDNTSTIGQFALATTTTIRDLVDVRAPAYGRNVIRQVPGTILVQGFARQPFGPGENAFSGRAVNAMNFAKRRIN